MSVIAAKVYCDHIEVAADSLLIRGEDMKSMGSFSKIESINDMIIGTSGYAREGAFMWQFAKTHKPASPTERDVLEFVIEFSKVKREWCGESSIENQYIIAYQGSLFVVEGCFVCQIKDYVAIGSGMYFATAALYLGKSAREAVDVACHLNCYVSEPIVSYEMKTSN